MSNQHATYPATERGKGLPSLASITNGIQLPPPISGPISNGGTQINTPSGPYYSGPGISNGGWQSYRIQPTYQPTQPFYGSNGLPQGINSQIMPTGQIQMRQDVLQEQTVSPYQSVGQVPPSGPYRTGMLPVRAIQPPTESGRDGEPAEPPMKNFDSTRPPRTSRFYRFFAAREGGRGTIGRETGRDGNSGNANGGGAGGMYGVTHHYNPYIYPQNRNRVNPPPDFLGTKRDDYSEVKPAMCERIPVVHPTAKEFKDPMAYVESIRELGEKYGAVKIVPPTGFQPRFAANLEPLWFKTRRQLWNSPVNELDSRYEFHKRMLGAAKAGKLTLNRLPCVDKRPIDLWRLHKSVQLRGGFQKCCGEKMWAQMGRELGFYGKITSSLSSSIKSAYIRYVLPLGLENVKHRGFRCKHHIMPKSIKKVKRENYYLPRITGSSAVFRRSRRMMISAGFNPYFDQGTTQKRGITVNDDTTMPSYDFYTWHHSSDVEDTSPFETRTSSLYNVRQYNEKSKALERKTLAQMSREETGHDEVELKPDLSSEDPRKLEKMFWKILQDSQSVLETEAACRLSTTVHESGFAYMPKQGITAEQLTYPWNLHNLPVCDGDSVLRYLPANCAALCPRLSLEMFFSVRSWAVEDHWLYEAQYEHMGAPRMSYFVPPRFREKFERLLADMAVLKNHQDATEVPEAYQCFRSLVADSDTYDTAVENRVVAGSPISRCPPCDESFSCYMPSDPPKRVNQDLVLSPEYLRKHGIPVYGCIQEPGDFVVKFPQSFGCHIALGTSICEAVNFAAPDWLSVASNAQDWLQKQQLLPAFSTFRLLLSIAHEATSHEMLKAVRPILIDELKAELDRRTRAREFARSHLSEETRDSPPNGTTPMVTDADLCDCYPSFIELTDKEKPKETFTMSLDYFTEHFNLRRDARRFQPVLVSFISDSELHTLISQLQIRLLDSDEWLEAYNKLLDQNSRPSLEDASLLVKQGQQIPDVYNSVEGNASVHHYFTDLSSQITFAENWSNRSSSFLQQTSLRNADVLQELVREIDQLVVEPKELSAISHLGTDVADFNDRAREIIARGAPLIAIRRLYHEGDRLNIQLPVLDMLKRIMDRNNWLDRIHAIGDDPTPDKINSLITEGLRLGSAEDRSEIQLLKKKLVTASQLEVEAEGLKRKDAHGSVSGEELKQMKVQMSGVPVSMTTRNDINLLVSTYEESQHQLEKLHINKAGATSDQMHPKIGSLEELIKHTQQAANYTELTELVRSMTNEVVQPLKEFYKRLHTSIGSLVTEKEDEEKIELQKMVDTDKMIFSEESGSGKYCFCRMSHEDDAMIECEQCGGWFHFKCLGLDPESSDSEHIAHLGFLCPMCDYEGKLDTTKYHAALVDKRPTLDTLKSLFQWAHQNLKATTPVIEAFSSLYEDAVSFHREFAGKLRILNGEITNKDSKELLFILTKLEGCSVNFAEERNQIKKQLAIIFKAGKDNLKK